MWSLVGFFLGWKAIKVAVGALGSGEVKFKAKSLPTPKKSLSISKLKRVI